MKCQKCSKSAIVHLTEILTDAAGAKRAVEIHLCLSHAADAGLVAPGQDILPHLVEPESAKAQAAPDTGLPTAIVPSPSSAPLALRGQETAADPAACPVCGLSWANFKSTGLMGCPHDYDHFELRLLPLLKRAQEGATEHVGKIPARKKNPAADRHSASLRLRRELQKALDAENYEQAAALRDQLKKIEEN
ncbi:MAG TPA: UvrB/UvrC motif-containing protein [Phycisphaerae bacterium]|nr:UvrB/UvrC motif-containing protein [Phycisphaerae bacterium]